MSRLLLNGEWTEDGSVGQSALGRGFAFGFGVFETIKFLEREPCFFEEHVERLDRAAREAGLQVALEAKGLKRQAKALFEAEGVENGVFKIVISDDLEKPNVALFVRSKTLEEGSGRTRLIASPVVKASRAFTSRHKSLNYMESLLELENARKAGFHECVFFNERGGVTECAVANLFWVKDGVLKTPALDCGLLDGIVRSKVLKLADQIGIPCEQGEYFEGDLLEADEVFLTSSGKGPHPASSYRSMMGEERRFGDVMAKRIRELFLDLERDCVRKAKR